MSEIIQSTTQQFLDIYDITNNFVIMKDGTVSTILTVDAMNFGLLAEEEQDAIMYAYAGLLNSLNYSVQIIINSRTKDVTSYLRVLQEQEVTAETETLRRRIRMYREFVGNLIHERNVLDKKFYVVIPAAAVEMGFLAASSVLPGQTKAFDISSVERSVIIEKAQNLLDPKRDHLIAQFARIGLFSRQLTTQEIIQLFYVRYNPEAAEGQQIGESNTYTTPLVKASIQGNFMNEPVKATPAPTTAVPQPEQSPQIVTEAPASATQEFATIPIIENPLPPMPSQYANLAPVPEIHITNTPTLEASGATPPSRIQTQPVIAQPLEATLPPDPVATTFTPTETIEKLPSLSVAPTPPVAIPTAPASETIYAAPAVSSVESAPTLPSLDQAAQQVQADIQQTIQSIGGTPTTVSTGSGSDLPPLPEI